MKKIIYSICLIVLAIAFASCGGKKDAKDAEQFVANEGKAEKGDAVDVIAQGEALVKASDCKTCHSKTNRIVGPSHTEVAQKYEFTEDNVKMLASKIINGGVGVWGEIQMVPHADIKQADAELMAKYVLSLDGEKQH